MIWFFRVSISFVFGYSGFLFFFRWFPCGWFVRKFSCKISFKHSPFPYSTIQKHKKNLPSPISTPKTISTKLSSHLWLNMCGKFSFVNVSEAWKKLLTIKKCHLIGSKFVDRLSFWHGSEKENETNVILGIGQTTSQQIMIESAWTSFVLKHHCNLNGHEVNKFFSWKWMKGFFWIE